MVTRDFAKVITSQSRSPQNFFLLAFALSTPFWLLGAVTGLQLSPGPPVSSFMVVCPTTAALILVHGENRTAGMAELLKRSFDYKRIGAKVWYVPTILFMPGVMALEYGLRRFMGSPIPAPQFPMLTLVVMLFVFFITGLGEELGWMGYAIDPLQARSNALQAGILLGLVWAAWHIIPVVQAGRGSVWIAWQCLAWVSGRVLIVWLYNNTGKSVFAAAVYHTMLNVSFFLFPVGGSYYDPRITGLIMTFAAAIVAVLWGQRTLARYRNS